jgi:hypothetical protein
MFHLLLIDLVFQETFSPTILLGHTIMCLIFFNNHFVTTILNYILTFPIFNKIMELVNNIVLNIRFYFYCFHFLVGIFVVQIVEWSPWIDLFTPLFMEWQETLSNPGFFCPYSFWNFISYQLCFFYKQRLQHG